MTEIDKNIATDDIQDDSYSLRDIVDMVIGNWMWFVVSIFACLLVAGFYIYKTPKTYSRFASILIKDSRRGNATASAFSELGSMKIIPNVDNEIAILSSKRLMTVVVKQLNLNIRYSSKGKIRTYDLYGSSPIDVAFVDGVDEQRCGFDVIPISASDFKVTKFVFPNGEDNSVIIGAVGDTVSTPVGRIVISAQPYMSKYIDKPITVRKNSVEVTALSYKNRVNASMLNKEASVIQLSLADVNPRRAEAILNKLMQAYQDDVMADKAQVLDITKKFINNRLSAVMAEVQSADKAVEQYKVANRLVDLQSQASQSLTESSRYRSEAIRVETQLSMVESVKDYVMDPQNDNQMIPFNVGVDNERISGIIGEYNEMLLNRNKLVANSGPNSPAVVDLNAKLNAKRQYILSSLGSLIDQLRISLQNAREQERLTSSQMASIPTQQSQYDDKLRQQSTKSEILLYLLNKQEENELARAVIDSDSRILDSAYGSPAPISPKTPIVLLLALVIGAALPFGVIILMNQLNTSVRGIKDIEGKINVPVLGDVPLYEGKSNKGIAVKEHGRDSVSEAFRMIRSNMNFMNVGGKQQVILVTSSNAGAGKTFVSTNLAMSLAISSKRVVVVDADMRKRTLTKMFGGRNLSSGLSKYLSDTGAGIDEMIMKSKLHDNLDMVFAGIQPPNPAELLLGERFGEFISELRKRYDYVILDSVPAMMVADAIIADRLCDLSIYVVREGLLDRRQLPDIERLRSEGKLHNMTLVLNGVRYMHRGYGYGYGYGYGMSEDEGRKKGFAESVSDFLRKQLMKSNILRKYVKKHTK